MELYRQKYYEALSNVNGVMVSATPLYSTLHQDHDFEMDVLIQISSGKLPSSYPRKSINLSLVLDRSGSMANSMESCKKAIECIINNLNENDTVHLIAYDDHVETIFSNCNVKDHKSLMLNKLISLKERGSTNLYDGVNAGLDILLGQTTTTQKTIKTKEVSKESFLSSISKFSKKIKEDICEPETAATVTTTTNAVDNGKTKILFLFSDGITNQGVTNSEKIGKMINDRCMGKEVFISTFGIGETYDDVLMSSIAFCGKGNYFYIQKPETIPSIVEKGLNGLTRHWTNNAELKVITGDNTVLTDSSELVLTEFKVREYALHRYLVKAKCSSDKASIVCILNYTDFEGVSRTKQVECSWDYVDNLNIVLVPNKQVRCYKVVNECSEINKEIMVLMDNHTSENEKKIKELKHKIIELYEGIIADDEYGIIPVLLKKEKDALEAMNRAGTYSLQASKQIGNTCMATGFNSKMCNYTSQQSLGPQGPVGSQGPNGLNGTRNDTDLGYASFM